MFKQKSYDKLYTGGTLYLVPTPIGNLQDMTFRSVETLKKVEYIASEDTRNTQKLLNHFEINTPQISFHDHNYKERIPELLVKLQHGESIAQVSDAGMPSISDPGHELVVAAIAQGIPVVPLPGATAGVTALVASGLPADRFSFYGFLKRKKNEQQTELKNLLNQVETQIFYESPHRVKATVANFIEVFGPDRQVVLCRELTKLHEEFLRGTAEEVYQYLADHDVKGECCLLLEGATQVVTDEESWQEWSVSEHLTYMIEQEGLTSKDAIKQVAKLRKVPKQEVYMIYHQ
ncbi:16S rRNA (cytidine(1402)-2'-O)-methyltransferase [Vagococcus coleopterorum]|uniref:Ribosomal RNA small subunit methyltransferase I n=1 Tax=Vagococcus coleopterorum TaxID=2714946 RepID=A0A6G8AN09_9ENTE|nr:16S rRNA (cytidine(1402)-2'-O)-methyltransferase [Vagococcus coleopterorum]QIL46360.1 16S rRNA (cytidine(1402)-2'-O)-methyltransferase [Vagococcus coleopterorum]